LDLFQAPRLEDRSRRFSACLIASSGKGDAELDACPVYRGDRELVDDTFRVTSLSLENRARRRFPLSSTRRPA